MADREGKTLVRLSQLTNLAALPVRSFAKVSRANPAYGLGWWLNRAVPPEQGDAIPQLTNATDVRPEEPAFSRDLIVAAGAGQQRLFVSPSERLVIVRQASGIRLAQQGLRGGARYTDSGFWRVLRGLPQA